MIILLLPGSKKYYWHIYKDSRRVGKIELFNNELFININKGQRNKGIGSTALPRALRLSRLEEVYATVSKKNEASLRLLKKCGFKEIPYEGTQIRLRWTKEVDEV